MFWPRLGALVLVVLASATSAALATGGKQPLAVTSSLDGKKVLPQMIRWLAHPNVAPADVAEVSFRIDGKLRWVEHRRRTTMRPMTKRDTWGTCSRPGSSRVCTASPSS